MSSTSFQEHHGSKIFSTKMGKLLLLACHIVSLIVRASHLYRFTIVNVELMSQICTKEKSECIIKAFSKAFELQR
jgi:heme/copper-type cytochrome/quinol oxidase subunit 1